MTQDEIWLARYNDVVSFIKTNRRNPSKYIPEERGNFLNWLKLNSVMMLMIAMINTSFLMLMVLKG